MQYVSCNKQDKRRLNTASKWLAGLPFVFKKSMLDCDISQTLKIPI